MAAAGVSSVAATKGLSVLAKWLIGSAAVTGTAVVTTLAVLNSSPEEPKTTAPAKTEATTPSAITPQQETIAPAVTAQEHHSPSVVGFEMPAGFSGGYERELPIERASETAAGDVVNVDLSAPAQANVPDRSPADKPPGSLVISWNDPKEATNATPPAVESTAQKQAEPAVIEFANVFTPNGDKSNDDYYLMQCINVKSVHVVITNTENKTVFESNDPKFQWDGTMNGLGEERVPDGTYACVVIYQDLNGKTFKKINILDIKR